MQHTIPHSLLFGMLLTCACGDKTQDATNQEPTANKHFSTLRIYKRAVFGSRQACEDYNNEHPDFWVNCDQIAEFDKDGRLGIMLTDIVGLGTYELDDDLITCTMEDLIDAPDVFYF